MKLRSEKCDFWLSFEKVFAKYLILLSKCVKATKQSYHESWLRRNGGASAGVSGSAGLFWRSGEGGAKFLHLGVVRFVLGLPLEGGFWSAPYVIFEPTWVPRYVEVGVKIVNKSRLNCVKKLKPLGDQFLKDLGAILGRKMEASWHQIRTKICLILKVVAS